ncbi:MAG TPA: GNAT family N-acetyltransferase [Herpetosiphonaceae bacterium]|nr:GNAT family N-acetyltransferase [Herpetosiphonaceae bacterium]
MSTNYWQGSRVRLRGVEPADWETFWRWDQDGEATRRGYFLPFPRSQEAARRWTEREATQEGTNDNFRWVIENLAGEMVGSINSHSCETRSGTWSYGIGIAREHQRKGFASETITLVSRYFFRELRYQKATVHVYSFNEPSVRLHERLGFQLEGRIRRMIYTGGVFWDDLVFGLTVDEFDALHGGDGAIPGPVV